MIRREAAVLLVRQNSVLQHTYLFIDENIINRRIELLSIIALEAFAVAIQAFDQPLKLEAVERERRPEVRMLRSVAGIPQCA